LGLRPGDPHYRAYVGPPGDYDLVSAMTFNLLTSLGLRQQHKLLDVGCGSLRVGRLLIPYLNCGNYVGIEPHKWLVDEGIRKEIGKDLIKIKKPRFYFSETAGDLPMEEHFDFAVAQSIFSHCGLDLINQWLIDIYNRLNHNGVLAATFVIDDRDHEGLGWFYPVSIGYQVETIEAVARNAGLNFLLLDWKHPRQQWALFSKSGFNASWIQNGSVTWNAFLQHLNNAR
jgi:SAM-dependent methyltransferase